MGGPLIRAKLEREGFKVIDFEEYNYDEDRSLIPIKTGVYCLFYGDTPQYVGRGVNLKDRLRQHLDNKKNKTDGYIPFGNYSWYVLHPRQIVNAEDMLIRYYDPPYNIIDGKRDDS